MIKGMTTGKRGLSAVITTLIIILLVLVAVGIIWVVVRNLLQEGAEQIDISAKCLSVDMSAVSVTAVANASGDYSVTLKRKAGGDAIGGIKLTLFNSTDNSGVMEFGLALTELETRTQPIAAGVTNANRLEYTAYFVDSSGNEQLCSQTSTFNF
ncbi:MAG TPA: hypothetical protein ENI22_01595 [Candidatus Pacearchaeota archaeon]|nr:hypothetical protein [Candidatus Pacearchaeota archaeon]